MEIILIPMIIKINANNTSKLNFGDVSKNILETKYNKIIFNETIIPTKVTSGDSLIECVNAILKLYPIKPRKSNNNNNLLFNFFGDLHFLSQKKCIKPKKPIPIVV